MAEFKTRDGDTIDWICWQHYGKSSGAVEAVYETNPGLAKRGPVFPAGVIITLPELPAESTAEVIRLWD